MIVFDIDSRSALPCVFVSHFHPYFVRLAPVACRVSVYISLLPLLVYQILGHLFVSTLLDTYEASRAWGLYVPK